MTRGEVASSGRAGGPGSTPPSPPLSRAPMIALWRMLLLSAAVACLFIAFPGGYESQRVLEMKVVAALLLLACLARFIGPHIPEPWALDLLILLIGLVSSYTAAQLPENEGQLLIGFGMMAVGVFTAFFRSTRHALALTGAIMAMWLVAVAVDRTLSSPAIALALVIIVLGVTLFVSQLVQRLHDLALHDGLTGLLNRRGLELLADPVIAGARRAGLPVTVAIVDVDRFKLFNDTRGHLEGDRLLVAMADAWTETVRDSDLLARFGGDEFVAVLVGATRDEARALDSRAAQTFSATGPRDWSGCWTVGIAELRADEHLHAAIDRADLELLSRKQTSHRIPQQKGTDGAAEPATTLPEQ